jgi:hypothetical protein
MCASCPFPYHTLLTFFYLSEFDATFHAVVEEEVLKVPKKKKTSRSVTPAKARKILRDGKIRGKKLTAKQRRYFGAKAGKGK